MNKDYFKTAKPTQIEEENEKEYSVKVSAWFSVMATSQEDADNYILEQFCSGNTEYTSGVEIDF